MGNGLTREWFEKIADPKEVEAFDRSHGIFIHTTPKCDHDWSGPEVKFENGASVTCAKCGMSAIDDAMRS